LRLGWKLRAAAGVAVASDWYFCDREFCHPDVDVLVWKQPGVLYKYSSDRKRFACVDTRLIYTRGAISDSVKMAVLTYVLMPALRTCLLATIASDPQGTAASHARSTLMPRLEMP
jgi:hypothetical protein